MAPLFPGLALDNDLGADTALPRFGTSPNMHASILRAYYSAEVSTELESFPLCAITPLKNLRNRLVHYIWRRDTDIKMWGVRFVAGKR